MEQTTGDAGFHQRLGHVLGALGGNRFWPSLTAMLRDVVTFDSWVALLFRREQPPLVLHPGYNSHAETALFSSYTRELYVLDPFYLFSKDFGMDRASGLYRLDEVAPECFRETEYFRRYFARMVGVDELQFLLPTEEGVLSLSLGSRTAFAQQDLSFLCRYEPWLIPLLRQAALADAGRAQQRDDQAGERWSAPSLEERLRQVPRLTDREVQTALLVLAGHSTKGIAYEMSISPETVKVHRRNLYDKLGISTQAALFALFLTRDSAPPNSARLDPQVPRLVASNSGGAKG